ncbi:YdcF family protein [Pusillimonas sp. CC-YST705]|uniref:YdcF family protein n=1 Tax=Mesopusillimonas faecipullorum TaxID=2755040 RepID=A0ABS8CG98_9BURK|nr:YdcF family protein [Mesopusillimonas faecipullorum]MCB5364834.1 YdcF family protein [Mesopusillimonas faecipullorum]
MSLSNFLAQFIIPLNLCVALLCGAVLMRILRCRRTAKLLVVVALIWGGMWSLPATSLWAGGWLEQRYPYQAPQDLPKAEAIVVLGGHTAGGRPNWFEDYDPDKRITRSDTAAQLYHANRAPLMVLSGALLDGSTSEAQTMAAALEREQIPAEAMILEERSQNTRENALFTQQELNERKIGPVLLVTSGLHMPRAMAAFKKLDIAVTAAPSPPQIVAPQDPEFSMWLPNERALAASRSIIKEYAALLLYWVRGWA